MQLFSHWSIIFGSVSGSQNAPGIFFQNACVYLGAAQCKRHLDFVTTNWYYVVNDCYFQILLCKQADCLP